MAAPITLEIPLTGAQEVPAVTGPGSGFARVTYDDATQVLTYGVTISVCVPSVGVNGR